MTREPLRLMAPYKNISAAGRRITSVVAYNGGSILFTALYGYRPDDEYMSFHAHLHLPAAIFIVSLVKIYSHAYNFISIHTVMAYNEAYLISINYFMRASQIYIKIS